MFFSNKTQNKVCHEIEGGDFSDASGMCHVCEILTPKNDPL